MGRTLLKRPELAEPIRHLQRACRLSRRWSSYVALNIKRHGAVRGNHVSGVYNDSWPDYVKDRLRVIAQAVGNVASMAFTLRPKGIHSTTITRLYREVALKEGCGFYGPVQRVRKKATPRYDTRRVVMGETTSNPDRWKNGEKVEP